MRQHIDLAILELSAHKAWLDELLRRLEPVLSKIRLHRLKWEQSSATSRASSNASSSAEPVAVPTDLFLRGQVQLRRYDALVLPVSLQTLGWTRQTLASAPRGPSLPIIGVLHDLRSGAILDLLALGLTDFITSHPCPQAFRARVIHAISRAPKPIALREPQPPIGRTRPPASRLMLEEPLEPTAKFGPLTLPPLRSMNDGDRKKSSCAGCTVQVSAFGWPDQGFGTTKERLITQFERQYLKAALLRANGNITVAASKSRKNRRAFWELLRKHGMVSGLASKSAGDAENSTHNGTGVKSNLDADNRKVP